MAYAPHELVQDWRRLAKHKEERANELGDCPAGLQLYTEATTLLDCAKQLEKHHHEDNHNGEWATGCPYCDREQREVIADTVKRYGAKR